jgi:hypothetical protein
MSSVIWHVTMSLDGFIADPDDSMDWVAASWEATPSFEDRHPSAVANEIVQTTGAIPRRSARCSRWSSLPSLIALLRDRAWCGVATQKGRRPSSTVLR